MKLSEEVTSLRPAGVTGSVALGKFKKLLFAWLVEMYYD